MPNPRTEHHAFKRQVVFRLGPDEWPLLEEAARQHGSIQAGLVAALRALAADEKPAPGGARLEHRDLTVPKPGSEVPDTDACDCDGEELTAREAARLLGLKPDTVSGYVRSGRLPGHYDDTPGRCGWVTSRTAVASYRRRVRLEIA